MKCWMKYFLGRRRLIEWTFSKLGRFENRLRAK
nr:MAG TPA: hypothetical protein [Caudoviricetes sp.]